MKGPRKPEEDKMAAEGAGEYVHLELNREFEFISGSYTLTEEGLLSHGGREVLYTVGFALLDRTCCGAGGCRFLNVPGYLIERHYRTAAEGRSVSRVEPILDPAERSAIRQRLERDFPHAQVNFLS
jgi:hypothetical protein